MYNIKIPNAHLSKCNFGQTGITWRPCWREARCWSPCWMTGHNWTASICHHDLGAVFNRILPSRYTYLQSPSKDPHKLWRLKVLSSFLPTKHLQADGCLTNQHHDDRCLELEGNKEAGPISYISCFFSSSFRLLCLQSSLPGSPASHAHSKWPGCPEVAIHVGERKLSKLPLGDVYQE